MNRLTNLIPDKNQNPHVAKLWLPSTMIPGKG